MDVAFFLNVENESTQNASIKMYAWYEFIDKENLLTYSYLAHT